MEEYLNKRESKNLAPSTGSGPFYAPFMGCGQQQKALRNKLTFAQQVASLSSFSTYILVISPNIQTSPLPTPGLHNMRDPGSQALFFARHFLTICCDLCAFQALFWEKVAIYAFILAKCRDLCAFRHFFGQDVVIYALFQAHSLRTFPGTFLGSQAPKTFMQAW